MKKLDFTVAVRITADSQEESDATRAWLDDKLGDLLSLKRGRVGKNPKYADDPKVLAYGDLEIPAKSWALLEKNPPITRARKTKPEVEK